MNKQNRIFKFRIWNKENDCWADVRHSLIEQVCLTRMDGYFSFEDIFQADYVDTPLIFQQFTGLKDCKGKEIYEGDIVLFRFNTMYSGCGEKDIKGEVCKTKYGEWIINGKSDIDKNIQFDNNFKNTISELEDEEVIGNIFETPELLK